MLNIVKYIKTRLVVRRGLNNLTDPTLIDRWWEEEYGSR